MINSDDIFGTIFVSSLLLIIGTGITLVMTGFNLTTMNKDMNDHVFSVSLFLCIASIVAIFVDCYCWDIFDKKGEFMNLHLDDNIRKINSSVHIPDGKIDSKIYDFSTFRYDEHE